ncbi:MAG: hypothetical protein Kow00107_06090 [Planctomycetota bacterium]
MTIQHESNVTPSEASRFVWSVRLISRMGAASIAILIFILAAAALAYLMFDGSLMWSAIAFFLALVCFGEAFFVHRYVLDDNGITVSTVYSKKCRNWSEFRRVEKFRYGVELLTRASESRFDFVRGIKLYLPEDESGIVPFIERKISEVSQKDKDD